MMLAATITDWLTDVTFMDNAPWQWGALFAVLLGSLVVGKVLAFLLVRHANRLGEVEGWVVLELVIRSAFRPIMLLVFAGGLAISENFMTLGVVESDGQAVIDLAAAWANAVTIISSLALGWLAYRLVDVAEHMLMRWTARTDTTLDDQLVPLIRKTLRVFVVIIASLFIAKNAFKADIGALIAGLGIGGLAFALAAKDTIANVFGSVMILIDRPFRLGDRIKASGQDGMVEEVGFRSTRIRTLEGHLVTIPNASLATIDIENVAQRPAIKRVLNVTVTYDTSPEKLQRAVDILNEMLAARAEHFLEGSPPKVYFSDFNADSLNIIVYYWFTPADWWEYLAFNHDFNMELLTRYNEEGIEFAFPTQTLYVKQDSDLTVDVTVKPKREGPTN